MLDIRYPEVSGDHIRTDIGRQIQHTSTRVTVVLLEFSKAIPGFVSGIENNGSDILTRLHEIL